MTSNFRQKGLRPPISRGSAARLGGYLAVGTFLAFCLAWWNRSLNPALAGDLFHSFAWEHGLRPYRDYWFAAPPGMFLLGIGIPALFGKHQIAFWTVGLALRTASVAVLYRWMSRTFHPAVAAVAVAVGAIASCGDVADSPYFYNHLSLALATAGVASLAVALRSCERRAALWWAAGAGALLGLSGLIKQTCGVVITVSALAFAAAWLWRRAGARAALTICGAAVIGLVLPWSLALLWMHAEGLLWSFVDAVFLSGTRAKGSLAATLLRPLALTMAEGRFHGPAAMGGAAVAIVAWLRLRASRPLPSWAGFVLAVVSLAAAALAASAGLLGPHSHLLALSACYATLAGNLAVAVASLRIASRRSMEVGLLAVLGFSAAYSLSISWPAFEVMLFPGLPLLIALAMRAPPVGPVRRLMRTGVVGACAALVVAVAAFKARHPGGFLAWEEPPIAEADTRPHLPELAGFVLNRTTAAFYDAATALIDEHSGPGDHVFVYPIFPELYAFADRLPATVAPAHLLDICPDRLAIEDAGRLRASPPAVMVVQQLPDSFYADQERYFRAGKPSGQRTLLRTLAELKPRYRVVGRMLTPGSGAPIEVWALER